MCCVLQNRLRCMITTITTRNVCAATRAAWTWRARTRRGRVASRTRSCVTSTSRTSRSWNAQTSCNSSAVSNRRVWAVQSPGGKAPPRLFSHCRHRLAPVSKNTSYSWRKWSLSSVICCNSLRFDNLPATKHVIFLKSQLFALKYTLKHSFLKIN